MARRLVDLRVVGGLLVILAMITVVSPAGAGARPGDLDPGFGTDGLIRTPVTGSESQPPSEIIAATGGGVLVAGRDQATGHSLLRKYLEDGTLDTGFGDGGTVSMPGSGWDSVAETGVGKVIVAGSRGNLVEITRLNAGGSADATFGTAGSFTFDAEPLKPAYTDGSPIEIDLFALKILDDGRIRAIGSYFTCRYQCANLIEIGLLADGRPDPAFADGSGVVALPQEGDISWALIEPEGRAHVIRGIIHSGYEAYLDIASTKVSTSGQLEPGGTSGSWLPGAGYSHATNHRAIALDDAGHLLIGVYDRIFDVTGEAYKQIVPGTQTHRDSWDVTRFLPWRNPQITINDLEIDADGKLLVSGGLNPGCCDGADRSGFVARFSPNGRPDATFGGDGIAYAWLGPQKVGYDRPPSSTTLALTGNSVVIAGKGRRGDQVGFNLAKFDAGSAKWLRCGGKRADYIGDDGSDEIEKESGTLITLGGNDQITTTNRSSICSGPGSDTISSHRYGSLKVLAGPGSDRVTGSKQKDRLRGGSGRDIIRGGTQDDSIYGGTGRDHLFGNGWNDRISGGKGRDLLKGGSARDQLFGGPGPDRLHPGRPGPLISIYRGSGSGVTTRFIRIGKRPISIRTVATLKCRRGEWKTSTSINNGLNVNPRTGRFGQVGSRFASNFKGRFSGRWVKGQLALIDSYSYGEPAPCWSGHSLKNPWIHFQARLEPHPRQFAKQ